MDLVGFALTNEETTHLMHSCTALKSALSLQLDAIGKMTSVSNEHVVSRLRQIQIWHSDIQIWLSTIISSTKHSTMLWVNEFSDGHVALERKVVVINERSQGLGWIQVERQCWPEVAVTYAWLLPLVSRLQDKLPLAFEQRELCATTDVVNIAGLVEGLDNGLAKEKTALHVDPRRVHFVQEVLVRQCQAEGTIDEQGVGKQSDAVLRDAIKTTVGRFLGKKSKSTPWLSDSDL